ncbi:TPA: hypothetical protein R6964_002391, partial [Klebsiella pneumoniae]|nr:hypothetical protein [Klebsiella pneumoniae]
MMVENDTSSVEYQLSTSTGPFAIPFYFIENGHISAWLYTENSDGGYDETTLTLDTDYILTGAGDSEGGTLTLVETHDGATLLIARTPDATQLTSYVATGKFPATSHERALDKLTMLIQQIYWWWDDLPLKRPNIFANFYHAKNRFIKYLKNPVDEQDAATKNYADGLYDGAISHADEQFKRTLRVPESSVNILPSINGRKKKILAFDDNGNPIAVLPESGSAADVLINLGLSDGLKWIGKCKDLSTLRIIEPTISGQSIILERAVIGGPLLNVILTHNPAASDAVDDGYSRFVTAGGAVWDADISFGHNVFLAGYSDELNNLADCLNMIIQDKVNKVISRGYVAGGVDAEIRIPPNPNAEGMTDFYMNKKSVKIPSFLRVYSAPGAIYDYSDFTTGVGIIGSNEFDGLTNDMMFLNNGGGWGAGAGASNSHNSGGFIGNGCLIKGPNTTSNPNATTYPGVRWGNVTYPGGNQAHFRDTTFSDARVSGWGSGFRPGSVNTYLMDVVACHFTNNTYGIDTYTAWSGSTPQWANSGEKMSFRGCLIGNNRSHAVYLDNRGDFFYFDMCSIDYNGGDVFHCSPTNLGEVNYINGHIEGNSGLILNCPTRTTNDGENNVKIRGAKIYPNKSTNDKYGGVRDIVFGTTIRTILELDSCNIFCRAPYVNGAYPTWKGYNPANLARLIIKYPGSGQTYRFLPSYDGAYGYRINDKLLFSGTENENVPTSRTGDFWCIKSGGASCVYGGAGDADSDGVIPIKITLNSPTDTVQLLFSRQITPERGTQ